MSARDPLKRTRPWRGDGRKRKLSPEQAELLRQWAANRQTLAEKAAELGISQSTAKCYIRNAHARKQA